MTKDRSPGITRSKWFLPAFSLVLGLVMLAVSWLGGSLGQGLISLAVLAAFGLVILLAGGSETVRALRGETAVKGQGLSRVIGGAVRKQPCNCIRDLLRASNPADGMHRTHCVECILGPKYVEQHLGPNRTRTHCVYPNTISPAFDRGSLGQAKHCVFAGHVGACGWKRQQAAD